MLRLSNFKASLIQGLIALKGLKDYFKVSVIQGLIARKGLKAKGFFRNLRMHLKKKKEKKKQGSRYSRDLRRPRDPKAII